MWIYLSLSQKSTRLFHLWIEFLRKETSRGRNQSVVVLLIMLGVVHSTRHFHERTKRTGEGQDLEYALFFIYKKSPYAFGGGRR